MTDFSIGDRVRVLSVRSRAGEPDTVWPGRIGVVEAAPGDYGVRFPDEENLRWFLGEELERAPSPHPLRCPHCGCKVGHHDCLASNPAQWRCAMPGCDCRSDPRQREAGQLP